MEMQHFLSLARTQGEEDLAKRITHNRFHIRLAGMIRESDPTSKILLAHYPAHRGDGSAQSLADLLINVCFCRNTMSREFVKLCEQGGAPWLRIESNRLTEASKKAANEVYLKLDGKVFFNGSVEPMKSRSKNPRRGRGEIVSELVHFARNAGDFALAWQGERAVEAIAAKIRLISGFNGKGFRWRFLCSRSVVSGDALPDATNPQKTREDEGDFARFCGDGRPARDCRPNVDFGRDPRFFCSSRGVLTPYT